MRRSTEIEGQDVGLSFVVKPETTDGERITELLRRVDGYAERSYPNTPHRVTGNSVELQFMGSRLDYDLGANAPVRLRGLPNHSEQRWKPSADFRRQTHGVR